MWTEVAKHLCGFDLLRLSSTCRWFRRLLADDSIWRYAFFRDLNLSDANPRVHHPLYRSWRYLYFAAFGKQSTKSIPPPVTRFGSLTDSRSRFTDTCAPFPNRWLPRLLVLPERRAPK